MVSNAAGNLALQMAKKEDINDYMTAEEMAEQIMLEALNADTNFKRIKKEVRSIIKERKEENKYRNYEPNYTAEESPHHAIVEFDGSEKDNKGGFGFVIRIGNKEIQRNGKVNKELVTNNIAEYTAVIKALEYISNYMPQIERVTVKGDHKIVINQIKGIFHVRSKNLKPLCKRVRKLMTKFEDVSFVKVERNSNKLADVLSKDAYM